MTEMDSGQVVVVGAGVSGLTTAICLTEAGRPVRMIAADPPDRTTSAVAGALWGPSFQEPVAKTMAWTEVSLREFRELARDPASGVRMAAALTVGDLPGGDEMPAQAKLIPDLRPCPSEELPDGFELGFRSTMPLIDMPRYLDYLCARLEAAGVAIERDRVSSLNDVADRAATVVNCTGLGARDLSGDRSLRPIRGQTVVLANQGLDEIFMELKLGGEWTSFFPHPERVVCGGVAIPDSWDTTVDSQLTDRIVERCRRIEPRLAEAEVVDVLVGLRPGRPAVRVEAERIGAARVVHNYGHGGEGVSLSWGCAREAAELALA